MKLHEYQAKDVLRGLGIAVPDQIVAWTPDEAAAAAEHFGGACVVKAQVHSGGRGKAGGVKLCNTAAAARDAAAALIGQRLYTRQSAGTGLYIPCVLVTERIAIERELYLAVTLDTANQRYVVIASAAGGMEIEEVAKETPEAVIRVYIPFYDDIRAYQVQYLADRLGFDTTQADQLGHILRTALAYMKESDANLIEINPLAVVGGSLVAADAKLTYDDNAMMRHADLQAMEDLSQIDPLERRAKEISLSYVRLDGNIACMVNGAGLAMATMDIIKSYGGAPANFMDVGGGVNAEKVTAAFELILQDPNVKAIFVNIFGGIAQCDVIAAGIVEATKVTCLSIPLVVRLRGTHEEEGHAILNQSGLDIISIGDFTEAAKAAIACVNRPAVCEPGTPDVGTETPADVNGGAK